MAVKSLTLYRVKDENVVNAILYNPEAGSFEYVPVSEINTRINECQESGWSVKIEALPAGEGDKIVIPLNGSPESNPENEVEEQVECAVISVIPKRYRKQEIPKEFANEGVTPQQYSKLTGAKELVVGFATKKLLKGTSSSRIDDPSSNKTKLANAFKRAEVVNPSKNTKKSTAPTAPTHKELPARARHPRKESGMMR